MQKLYTITRLIGDVYATDAAWLEVGNKGTDSADTLNEQENESNALESEVEPKSATEMFRVPERP